MRSQVLEQFYKTPVAKHTNHEQMDEFVIKGKTYIFGEGFSVKIILPLFWKADYS